MSGGMDREGFGVGRGFWWLFFFFFFSFGMGSLGKVFGLGELGMVRMDSRGYRWGRWGLGVEIFVGQWIRMMGWFLYVMGIDRDGVMWWTGLR